MPTPATVKPNAASQFKGVTFMQQGVSKPQRQITIQQDVKIDFPELYLEVYIEGPRHDAHGFAEMFARTGSRKVTDPLDADLVIFTGGADVDPALYGERRHPLTHPNRARDDIEMKLYLTCLEHGIPMFGVCRGSQLLHVMNGGKLFQHVDGHHGDHPIFSIRDKLFLPSVSSVHHQMCIENKEGGMEVLAHATKSTERWLDDTRSVVGKRMDVEAYFYRETCCFGVQGHPEYRGYPFYTKWCLDMIDQLIVCNPDIEFVGRNRRVKKSLIEQRKLSWAEHYVEKETN